MDRVLPRLMDASQNICQLLPVFVYKHSADYCLTAKEHVGTVKRRHNMITPFSSLSNDEGCRVNQAVTKSENFV